MNPRPEIAADRLHGGSARAAEDTAAGCRQHAAADLARAAQMDTANGRHRLETSAASWENRAVSIEDMDDSSEARRALARAEWLAGEGGPQPHDESEPGAGS